MMRLSKAGLEERARFISWAVGKKGVRKVEAWLADPGKLRIINALCEAKARKRRRENERVCGGR